MLSKALIGAGIIAVGLAVFFGARWLTTSFVGDPHDDGSHRPSIAVIEQPAVPPPPDWPAPRKNSKQEGASGTKAGSTDDGGSTEIEPAPVELPEQSGPPLLEEPPSEEETGGGDSEGGSSSEGGGSGNGWVTSGQAGG